MAIIFPDARSTSSAASNKKKCVLYTTMIGNGLRALLPMSDPFSDEYIISTHVIHRVDGITEDVSKLRAELDDCRLMICHHPDTIVISDPRQRAAHERIVASVPTGCQVLRIPHFYCPVLWPFHCVDPRNDAQSRKDADQPPVFYEWGDAYILERLNEGAAPETVIEHYLNLDVSTVVSLDTLLARTVADARRADALSDIRLASHFEETFGLASPFVAYYLPSNFFLLCFVNEILKSLGFSPLPERILEQVQPLLRPQVPIHPSIGRYFGLPYVTEQTRYLLDRRMISVDAHHHMMDRRRQPTFAEYVRDYVYFV